MQQLVVPLLLLAVIGCSAEHDPPSGPASPTETDESICLTKAISPSHLWAPKPPTLFNGFKNLIAEKCISCHTSGGIASNFEILQTEDEWISSTFVSPRNPDRSLVYFRLKGSSGRNGPKNMPTGLPISDDELAIVKAWINSTVDNGPLAPEIKNLEIDQTSSIITIRSKANSTTAAVFYNLKSRSGNTVLEYRSNRPPNFIWYVDSTQLPIGDYTLVAAPQDNKNIFGNQIEKFFHVDDAPDSVVVPITPSIAKIRASDRLYVASVLQSAFGPAAIDAINTFVVGQPTFMGGACDPYDDCDPSSPESRLPAIPSITTGRFASVLSACSTILSETSAARYAIEEKTNESYCHYGSSSLQSVVELFYPSSIAHPRIIKSLDKIAEGIDKPDEKWRAILFTLCSDPGWQTI